MNVEPGIWEKLSKAAVFLFVVALVLLIAQWYVPLIRQNERMRKEVLRLETQKQKEAETAKQLKATLDALRFDTKTLERLVRERLGYMRPDEKGIIFEAPVTNAPAGAGTWPAQ